MKKFAGLSLLIGLIFGFNSVLFAQGNPPPPPMEGGKMGKRGGPDGPGGMRGGRGGKHRGMRGHRGGMRGGGFGISDEEIAKLNLTDAQKVKLFDFRKKMADEREAMRKNFKPGEEMKPEGINPEEMRQLMNAKMLGTLTAEQKAKLDGIEAKRKEMMEKRKTEMEARKAKMEKNHQEFLNIFTLEQRKQIEQMRNERAKQMQERMKQRRENRPDGPKGPKNPKPPTNPPTPTE
jgi:hypothetical protein